jgi:2-hydroxychromene-2-carboxylate isomerase
MLPPERMTSTFIVDGEMFWGADRLWQIKRWIEQGGW